MIIWRIVADRGSPVVFWGTVVQGAGVADCSQGTRGVRNHTLLQRAKGLLHMKVILGAKRGNWS